MSSDLFTYFKIKINFLQSLKYLDKYEFKYLKKTFTYF